jgi:hypothetical protein
MSLGLRRGLSILRFGRRVVQGSSRFKVISNPRCWKMESGEVVKLKCPHIVK